MQIVINRFLLRIVFVSGGWHARTCCCVRCAQLFGQRHRRWRHWRVTSYRSEWETRYARLMLDLWPRPQNGFCENNDDRFYWLKTFVLHRNFISVLIIVGDVLLVDSLLKTVKASLCSSVVRVAVRKNVIATCESVPWLFQIRHFIW